MQQPITRRSLLHALASLPLATAAHAAADKPLSIAAPDKRPPIATAAKRPSAAPKPPSIERLIADASTLPTATERIAFISQALLGRRYLANTLIGGPKRKEVFVVRDDAFDCVTYCEVVLAAAFAHDGPGFEQLLRRIRYAHGEVKWDERNHYFADWTRRAVENGICQPVAMEPAATIKKTVGWRDLGKHDVSFTAVSRATLLANTKLLASGDVIGFVSGRPNLDFFHTGLITFGKGGEAMLRHASRRRGQVADERLDGFVAANGVQYVTLSRPVESTEKAERG